MSIEIVLAHVNTHAVPCRFSSTSTEAEKLNEELLRLQKDIASIEANGVIDVPRVK